jgi:Predicted outer membrane protein
MKRKKRCYSSEWFILIGLLLLALIVPSMAAQAAREGTITVKRFRVEDYQNLQDSTGQSSDMTAVPAEAQKVEGIVFQLERLLISSDDAQVSIFTPIDTAFPAIRKATDISGETTFANLPEGYYLVSEITAIGEVAHTGKFVVRIPNITKDANGNEVTTYDVIVYPKGQKLNVEKRVSSAKHVVGIGDTVRWNVIYPIGSGLKRETITNGEITTIYARNFYLTDEMDTRLNYVEDSVSFRYYDVARNEIDLTLTEGVDYHLSYDTALHILTIHFTDDVGTRKVADENVAYMEMELDTKVSVSAVNTVEPLWNNARIHFENTAGDSYEQEVFPAELINARVVSDENALTRTASRNNASRNVSRTAPRTASEETVHQSGIVTFANVSSENTGLASWEQEGSFTGITTFEDTEGTHEDEEVVLQENLVEDSRIPSVYLGQIVITKVDAQDRNKRLEGATFHLADSKRNAEEGNFLTRIIDQDGTEEVIHVTTDANGEASIRTIGAGTYYLVETSSPEGYHKLSAPIEVTVLNDPGNHIVHVEINNTKDSTQGADPDPNDTGKDDKRGFTGGVKTGDVVRMTGIVLLMLASVGIVVTILRKDKHKEIKK